MVPSLIAGGPQEQLNYTVHYTSWSAGALYAITPDFTVFGRASRFCSHKSLPPRDRAVRIYVYAAFCGPRAPVLADATPETSVDLFMLGLAAAKRAASAPHLAALRACAVDRPRK